MSMFMNSLKKVKTKKFSDILPKATHKNMMGLPQQYLALDIGNVICHMDFSKMAKIMNISEKDMYSLLTSFQIHQDLGMTTMNQEMKKFLVIEKQLTEDHPDHKILFNKVVEAWKKSLTPNKKVLATIKKLQENKVKIALLSNIGFDHAAILPTLITKDIYDNCVPHLSCHVGARKPTLLFYQSFLLAYPDFYGCIYVDDKKENLEMASKFSFSSHYFDLSNKEHDINAMCKNIIDHYIP